MISAKLLKEQPNARRYVNDRVNTMKEEMVKQSRQPRKAPFRDRWHGCNQIRQGNQDDSCTPERKSKSKACLLARWPIRARAYPGFWGTKRLRVFFTPPWMGCQSIAGLPPAFRRYPFIHLGGERNRGSKVSCPRTQHKCPRPGPEPGQHAVG